MARRHPGLTIRGNSVQIAFTHEGQRCRETIKLGAPPTKTQLDQLANKRSAVIYDISLGIFDYKKHFPTSKTRAARQRGWGASSITTKEMLKEWIVKNKRRFQKATWMGYESDIHNHLIPAFGQLTLNQLRPKDVRDWIADQTCSAKRINNILIPLRRTFADAFENELIDNNPLERIKNLPHVSREVNPFNRREIALILSQLEGAERNLIQFAFFSGLRTSELIALRWHDVDFLAQKAHIRSAKVRGIEKSPKTNAGSRTIDLEQEAIEALEAQLSLTSGQEFIFLDPVSGFPWKNDQPIRRRVWTPALHKADLKYRKPYSTRHTYASILLSEGRNPVWLAKQMGHADWGMLIRIYGRWIPDGENNGKCR